MGKILIVDDDKDLNNGLCFAIKRENYDTVSAFDYYEAKKIINENDIMLAIIDINLPQKNGIDLCVEIKKLKSIPIIFLTAKDSEDDILKGFKCGCDDYISKPFSVPILIQRINAVLRRNKNNNLYEKEDLKIDFDKMEVYKNNECINVTKKEFELLDMLCKNRGKVIKRNNIIEKLWDVNEEFIDSNTLSVTIKRLRQKIESDSKNPKFIVTVFGIGYTWGYE